LSLHRRGAPALHGGDLHFRQPGSLHHLLGVLQELSVFFRVRDNLGKKPLQILGHVSLPHNRGFDPPDGADFCELVHTIGPNLRALIGPTIIAVSTEPEQELAISLQISTVLTRQAMIAIVLAW
jgi:hypothetical protein